MQNCLQNDWTLVTFLFSVYQRTLSNFFCQKSNTGYVALVYENMTCTQTPSNKVQWCLYKTKSEIWAGFGRLGSLELINFV